MSFSPPPSTKENQVSSVIWERTALINSFSNTLAGSWSQLFQSLLYHGRKVSTLTYGFFGLILEGSLIWFWVCLTSLHCLQTFLLQFQLWFSRHQALCLQLRKHLLKKPMPYVLEAECNYFTDWNLLHDCICLFKYGKYLAHRIGGILVSWDMKLNWTWPSERWLLCWQGVPRMTWKVYCSSNFDDVILTRWGQWHIRLLLMLPLCFSSWIYSSGNCIFSLAWALNLWCMCVTKAFCVSRRAGSKGFMKELSKSHVCIYISILLRKLCDLSQIAALSVFYLFEHDQWHDFLMLWCHVHVWRKIINHSTTSHHVWFFLKRAG